MKVAQNTTSQQIQYEHSQCNSFNKAKQTNENVVSSLSRI